MSTNGIISIQRDREKWLLEWLAFHLAVGFDKIFIYAHKCEDRTGELLAALVSCGYEGVVNPYWLDIDETQTPQPRAYRHAWELHGHNVDWMAFIDGDEFLFPVTHPSISDALDVFKDAEVSALAAYWVVYGTSGHFREPNGLVVENFTRHAPLGAPVNQSYKSIVRGGEKIHAYSAHFFRTDRPTVDEKMRKVGHPKNLLSPTHEVFRINHYSLQSWQFCLDKKVKQPFIDLPGHHRRTTEYCIETDFDCSAEADGAGSRWILKTKIILDTMINRLVEGGYGDLAEAQMEMHSWR